MSTDPYGPTGRHEPEPYGPPNPGPPVPPGPADMEGADRTPPSVKQVHFTRAAALWSAVIGGLLILIVLLIFIAQNTESAQFAFLGWQWHLPLGVAILFAAVCGGLIASLAGAARLFQLRRAAKKNYKAALR
ncbi:LapA family protein [Mycobacterium deserti]|uniref:Lipopolysaccharide assembly protein LapA domain-containing protein n=1 Tax=Mycobacterium deserti TaxID=2978347 RepID=A0ABT2MI04_9MYCO|nr:lipopolysaccharide assembly protein LapA domain-containing protein [Mycobacterium deserti]MCT7661631.1 lipopolysaccharide assembly protein LapA domain-containing protein [Mycobacterium deserti]